MFSSEPAAIEFVGVSKRFQRNPYRAAWHGVADGARRLLRRPAPLALRPGEFWALRDISFSAPAGQCLGIIGPNGAGKSTLLKLIHRELFPDQGRVATRGRQKSLLRLGGGLQPLLSGRENIYLQCAELGLGKRETDARVDEIVAFAGLEKSIDAPVKHYSDGMYARLEFAAATCVPTDILLIDEVLAVSDLAFQVRAIDRLAALKRAGTAIVLVSHSEMLVRQVADRCLLLFDGEVLGHGEPQRLFDQYYSAAGFSPTTIMATNSARPTGHELRLGELRLGMPTQSDSPWRLGLGERCEWGLSYSATQPFNGVSVVLEFRNSANRLVASLDSQLLGTTLTLQGQGTIHVTQEWFPLAAGRYKTSAGIRLGSDWLAYDPDLGELIVVSGKTVGYPGVVSLPGIVTTTT